MMLSTLAQPLRNFKKWELKVVIVVRNHTKSIVCSFFTWKYVDFINTVRNAKEGLSWGQIVVQ